MRGLNEIRRQNEIADEQARQRRDEKVRVHNQQVLAHAREIAKAAAKRLLAFDDHRVKKFLAEALTDLNCNFPKGREKRSWADDRVVGFFLVERLKESDWFEMLTLTVRSAHGKREFDWAGFVEPWFNSFEKGEPPENLIQRLVDEGRECALSVLERRVG